MAKIKGITIELNADTTGIEKALNDTNKALAETQKQLSSVSKSLKMDPKNLDLVEQKQRLLAKATQETAKKLEALKAAQQQVANEFGKNDKAQAQYDALTREISDTTKKLEKLNAEEKAFSKQAAQAQYDASGLGSALNRVGEAAAQVAEKTKYISAAAAGALTALVGMTVNASKYADDMLTMAQQTGLSAEALQKMKYAAEVVDVPIDTITGAIRKMKGNLDKNVETWEKLGVQVKNQKGEYRDIESIFFDVIKSLGNIENETERDTLAMDLFGKKADELAGIIDDGGAALQRLGTEAEQIGVIVPEEDLERLADFNDQLEIMKSQITGALVQLAIPVLQSLEPIINAITGAVRKIAELLSHVNKNVLTVVMAILALIAAISPVAKAISLTTTAIRTFVTVIPMAITGMQALNASFMAFISNPYVLLIGAIVAALALLGVAIYEVVENWEYIEPVVDDAVSAMKSGIDSIISAVQGIGTKILSGFTGVGDQIADSFGGAGDKIREKFSGVSTMIRGVSDAFRELATKVADAIHSITEVFDNIKDQAGSAGAEIIGNFANGIRSMIQKVTQAFQQMANAIKSIWTQTATSATAAGRAAGANYVNGYSAGANSNRSLLQNIPGANPNGGGGSYSYPYGGGSPSGGNGYAGAGNGALLGAINELNRNIERYGSGTQNVNVELVGSAKNIFDTVRVQNNRLQTATGYHALA